MILHLFFLIIPCFSHQFTLSQNEDYARDKMNYFNHILKSMNASLFVEAFTNPYTIHWCDKYRASQTTQINIDEAFEYPLGSEKSFGLGVVAFNPVYVETTGDLQYETKGFAMHNVHEMKWDGQKMRFSAERRYYCHEKLFEN